MRVGIWIRVSTEEQAKGESPRHHEERARFYAKMKGWQVFEIYDLSGVSGKEVLSHSEAQRMLEDVRRGHIQALIFSRLSRLARNVKELLEIAEVFQKYGANLVSLDENIDTSTPAGRLLFVVIGALAQWEREEIAERVRATVPVRARLGKPTGGIGPFGYKWENGKLVPNSDEANVVKRAFQLYLETGKILTTCRMLAEEGLKARKSYFKPVTLKRILTDPVYMGLKRANYTRSRGNGKSWELKPEDEWVYFEVPSLIEKELWEKVNTMIRQNGEKFKHKRIPKEGKYLFSGLVVCGLCGKKMYVYPYEGMRDSVYVCRCRNKIRESVLVEKFLKGLENVVVNAESLKNLSEDERKKIEELEERKKNLENQLRRVQKGVERLFILWEDALIEKEDFQKRFKELKERENQLKESIMRVQGEIDFYRTKFLGVDFFVEKAIQVKEMWELLEEEEKREVAKILLDRIQVGESKVMVFYDLPEEVMQLENYSHIYRGSEIILGKSTSGFYAKEGLFLNVVMDILPQERIKGYPVKLEHIGDYLRKKRLEAGITVKELAEMFKVSKETILNWEFGRKRPSNRMIPKILKFLQSEEQER